MSFDLSSYAGGVASTVAGSWIASKIRVYHDNRMGHLEDLKQKVLVPLRSGLRDSYGRLVEHQRPVVEAEWQTVIPIPDVKVTEEATTAGWFLRSSDPRGQVEAALDEALLEDARRNHYSSLIQGWGSFRDAWTAHKTRCESLAAEIARRLVSESGLVPYKLGVTEAHVLHVQLAAFVYLRLFAIPTSTLQVSRGTQRPPNEFALVGNPVTFAIGREEQVRKLLEVVQGCLDREKKRAGELLSELEHLRRDLEALSGGVSLAIASRRLKGHCPFVRFF